MHKHSSWLIAAALVTGVAGAIIGDYPGYVNTLCVTTPAMIVGVLIGLHWFS